MLKAFLLIYCIFTIFPLTYTTDYCKICKNKSHTMCKYKGRSKSCINYDSAKMTPKIQALIENLHNQNRNKVASGQETRGSPGPQPSASNMFILKWDDELSKIAQRWADQCRSPTNKNQHDECKLTKRFEVGQNVIQGIKGSKTMVLEKLITKMINRWYEEVTRIGINQIKKFKGVNDPKKEVGHYSQLVWAKTKYIGCAYVSFAENFTKLNQTIQETVNTFVCNYGPTGNVVGASMYKIGKPCSACKCSKEFPALCESIEPQKRVKKTKTETKREAKGFTKTTKATTIKKKSKVRTNKTTKLTSPAAKSTTMKTESTTITTTAVTTTVAVLEVRDPPREGFHHMHHHLKGEKCPFESIRTRSRVLHQDGDECYCLYRVTDLANQLLSETYLLYLFLLILYYF